MEFINIFAEFLKNTCHLVPYLVDWDVGIQVREIILNTNYVYDCKNIIPIFVFVPKYIVNSYLIKNELKKFPGPPPN